MRAILAVFFLLAGCSTFNSRDVERAHRPTFPHHSRTPAAAQPDENVHIVQLFCPDGNFYFKAETAVSDYPGNPNCLTMVEEDMNSPVPIRLNYFTRAPSGNFADVVLEKALNYNDRSYRDMPMKETRDYLVRSGQCGNQAIFLVASAANGFQQLSSAAQNICRFEPEFKISSHLPLAGVYPRVFGESLQSFVIKLTSK
jgi:hypothetical protein